MKPVARRSNLRLNASPSLSLSQMMGDGSQFASTFLNFSQFIDASGKLNFAGKAILHADGVDFGGGPSYKINITELRPMEELGRGKYGVVQKVHHLPTNVIMAMKEIRLELDQTKLNQILMELEVLHKSNSPFIVEFYGAFFVESCVYYCMEYMDAGSMDKLYVGGMDESVLAKIALSMVKGLHFLKEKLHIIHRDVKPTNILINTRGQVKLCDFGVSGQLIQSLAKTNVGCQSYMAPERFSVSSTSSYSVSADIWSLGLSLVEMSHGKYPYPADQYDSLFAQLNAIVQGDPPSMPDHYSLDAKDFIRLCLNKDPKGRPGYKECLEHPWLVKWESETVPVAEWVAQALQRRIERDNRAAMPPPDVFMGPPPNP